MDVLCNLNSHSVVLNIASSAEWYIDEQCIINLFVSLFSVKREDYLNTFEFLDKLAENLNAKMSSWLIVASSKL